MTPSIRAPFVLRQTFNYPSRVPSWYIGHMVKSLRDMGSLLRDIDMVIEARDSRLPLTSINGAFDAMLERVWGWTGGSNAEELLNGKEQVQWRGIQGEGRRDTGGRRREKLVVYTKRDLAEEKYEKPLVKAFQKQLDQRTIFVDTRHDADLKKIMKHAVDLARANEHITNETNILVVGMPNVGKSSLLNSLRRVGVKKGKAFRVGNLAGVTRKLTGTVKIHEDPNIYVYDTPGVMVPFLGHGDIGAERGLKYALTAGIKDDLFEREVVGDYLLWRMNRRQMEMENDMSTNADTSYLKLLSLEDTLDGPTDDIHTFLDALSNRIGALKPGGVKDHDVTLEYLINAFRSGKLGRWTLDNLEGASIYDSKGALSFGLSTHPSLDLPEHQRSPQPVEVFDQPLIEEMTTEAEVSEQLSDPIGPARKSGPNLDESVADSLRGYRMITTARQAEVAEGRGLSSTQQKKVDLRAKAELKREKLRARREASGKSMQPRKVGPKRKLKRR